MHTQERRDHERVNQARPCKLYLPATGSYVAGATANVSAGGALLEINRSETPGPGDRLFLGVARNRGQALLAAGEMTEAEVVRVTRTAEKRTTLAVRFVGEPARSARRAA